MRRVFSALACVALLATSAWAEPVPVLQATPEELRKAMPHYARSRQLLITAVREFDKGFQKVNPEMILDGDEWRQTLLDRIEEMERLLAPQPRAAKEGLRFEPNPGFLSGSAAK